MLTQELPFPPKGFRSSQQVLSNRTELDDERGVKREAESALAFPGNKSSSGNCRLKRGVQ